MHQILSLSRCSLFLAVLSLAASPALSQVYRCSGSGGAAPEYINNVKDAQARGCKTMEGGNVTVMQGPPAQKSALRMAATVPSAGTSRTDTGTEQKVRDSDARSILESELKKSEAKLTEQQKEYNNGEPEKQGIEGRNYQRYLERVAELKDGISRNQSDIAGLKREISRLPSTN